MSQQEIVSELNHRSLKLIDDAGQSSLDLNSVKIIVGGQCVCLERYLA